MHTNRARRARLGGLLDLQLVTVSTTISILLLSKDYR